MTGATISHYKITEKLGEGGMGVVYKAEDVKLKRPVALKFLAAHLLDNEDGKERFIREAQAAAALNHQNICTVYEIDDAGGQTFIAMAFIEGQTVKDKIAERPLRLDQALDIAVQTAQGLQVAHEKGIVHRDIKNANIMVTPRGQVKIMDFGLAQLAERSKLTGMTTILGTPSYMSPEQAVGKKTDRRTDLWSLGVVLYEMVAGRLPFVGERQEAILYGITSEEPEPVTAQRAGLPLELEWIISKALTKDRDERYQHAEDLLVDLHSLQKKLASGKSAILKVQAGTQTVTTQTPKTGQASPGPLARYRVIEKMEAADESIKYLAEDTELHRSVSIQVLPQSSADNIERGQQRKQTVLLAAAALGVLFGLIFAFFPLFAPTPVAEAPLRRFTLPPEGAIDGVAISPNGRHVAYISGSGSDRVLWVRDLDQKQARAVVGPTVLYGWMSWSPDSQFVGFQSQGALKKVAASGGPVVTLVESDSGGVRAAWTPDGESVIFKLNRQLYSVPARGGKAELWLETEQEGFSVYGAAFFSAGEGTQKLLYVEGNSNSATQIIALDRASGQREILAAGGMPVYSPSGHVIYESNNPAGIWAVPFSVGTMKATGNPFPISEKSRAPSIALDGTLVYLEGASATGLTRLGWRDRQGARLGEIGEPHDGSIGYPGLSPDGSRVVVQDGRLDIWIHEVNRPIKTRLTTLPTAEVYPSWSPQGDRIVFSSGLPGQGNLRDLYMVRADGSEDPVLFLESSKFRSYVTDWSPDGNTILVWRQDRPGGLLSNADIWYLKRKEGGGWEEVLFMKTEHVEQLAKLSPDGRFIAYGSNRSGEREIYIRSFPDGTGLRRVSASGGTQVRWRKDGKELFYVEGDSLMAVPVTATPALTIGTPERLFSDDSLVFRGDISWLNYDVSPDGQRFILRESEAGASDAKVRVVQNWFAEFKDQHQD